MRRPGASARRSAFSPLCSSWPTWPIATACSRPLGRGWRAVLGARPVRLLALVFAVASAVTAVLSLDATVVLLTPVVLTTVARLRLRAKPHAYACTHLANSASLLLPVSNLN